LTGQVSQVLRPVFVIIGEDMMTVGEYLRKLREEKGITLEQIASETNIRLAYLQAIENDQTDQLPSLPQAKGFTRLYAAHLGISSRDVFEEVEELNHPEVKTPTQEESAVEGPAPLLVEKPQPVTRKLAGVLRKSSESTPHPEKPASQSEEIQLSQVIFNEIGRDLKRQREALGLTLEDVERLTKIREFFLYALENGQVDDLPSTVQGRGMLNNYSAFLNLSVDALQLRYAEGLQQKRQETAKVEEEERKGGVKVMGREPLSGWRRFLTPDLLVGGSVFLALFGLVIWGALQMIRTTNPEPVPTISSISDVLINEGTQDAASTALATNEVVPLVTGTPSNIGNPQVDISATFAAGGNGPIQIVVVVYQRAFMKITVDGVDVFAGRVLPGNVYSYSGNSRISLLTGNAAALQVYYNQQDQGILGPIGQVVELEFTQEEMMTPTPRFSPTPTLTPLPTLTARPTATPQPSPTIPTATITPARTVNP